MSNTKPVFKRRKVVGLPQAAGDHKKQSLHTTGPLMRAFFCLCSRSYFQNFAFISETDTQGCC